MWRYGAYCRRHREHLGHAVKGGPFPIGDIRSSSSEVRPMGVDHGTTHGFARPCPVLSDRRHAPRSVDDVPARRARLRLHGDARRRDLRERRRHRRCRRGPRRPGVHRHRGHPCARGCPETQPRARPQRRARRRDRAGPTRPHPAGVGPPHGGPALRLHRSGRLLPTSERRPRAARPGRSRAARGLSPGSHGSELRHPSGGGRRPGPGPQVDEGGRARRLPGSDPARPGRAGPSTTTPWSSWPGCSSRPTTRRPA